MAQLKALYEKYADYKYLALCLISVVILVTAGGIVVWPLYAEHLSIEQESKAIQQRLQVIEQFAGRYKNYEESHSQYEVTVSKLQELLPSSLEGIDAMNKVQKLAQASGVTLNVSRMNNNTKQDKLFSVGVDIKAKGSYAAMLKFLENLEQNSLTGLEQLHLHTSSDGMLTLNGKYYVYGLKVG